MIERVESKAQQAQEQQNKHTNSKTDLKGAETSSAHTLLKAENHKKRKKMNTSSGINMNTQINRKKDEKDRGIKLNESSHHHQLVMKPSVLICQHADFELQTVDFACLELGSSLQLFVFHM